MRRVAILLPLVLLAGCDQRMMDQPRDEAYESAPRAAPEGVVARGDAAREAQLTERPAMSLALLTRGRDQFDAFCAPCHGRAGDGRGIIVERGMPAPPSYHSARLRGADPSYFVDVITNGHGVMYSYAERVAPQDRWAIAAYIQALQLSQSSEAADAGPGRTP